MRKNFQSYIKAFVIVLIYFTVYNALGYFLSKICDEYFEIKNSSIVNIMTYSLLLAIIIIILKKGQDKGFLQKIDFRMSFKKIICTILITVLLKIFKDPILSYYEIVNNNIFQFTIQKNFFSISDYWMYLIYFILIIPVLEEVFFRLGILQYLMRHSKSVIYPILFSSFFFALIHINYQSLSFSDLLTFFNAFIFGILTATIYVRTRSIIYPILLHIFVNTIGFLCDVVYVYEYFEVLKSLNFGLFYWALVIFSGLCIILLLKVIGNSHNR